MPGLAGTTPGPGAPSPGKRIYSSKDPRETFPKHNKTEGTSGLENTRCGFSARRL